MNRQPIEQSDRPGRPVSNQPGAASPTSLLNIEQRAISIRADPSGSMQKVEHLSSTPGARRISVVEKVALQILSGAIEVSLTARQGLGGAQGGGRRRWPAMLNRTELCEYTGVSWRTLKNVLTVRPVDMGANVVRYSRVQVDEWVASLPPRLLSTKKQNDGADEDAGTHAEDTEGGPVLESRVEAALDRVRARAGGSKWRKTA